MTKEIIIDGIDVSECEFLWKEKLPKKVCNNGNLNCDCNSNLSCYFKQLAIAKDKINYMEEYIKTVENARNDLERELKRKEQECEELKQWKKDAENLFKTQTDNADKIINLYKKTLDDVENSLKTIIETNRVYPLQANLQKVLNSINKVKEK